ncbi:molybdopterin dinucleotide binding domain-containing protein [Capillimicrobium parvum]|uniref:molybdopterin dinucleotide binding domain-containing protein n=1 Tax=Capillimicrobium parvum TaxID=2884022 RepID=UPI00216AC03B|nr:molybdopterin dinucleotide binding domain-containing protein [Capillimicrobium parvum]
MILQCHNAIGAAANARAASEALLSDNLELLVVHDLFLNKTASLADYVLPAAHWLEKPFYSAAYGYAGWAGDYVEAKPAAVPARHPSDYDLWRDLGRRFGQAEHWPEHIEEYWNRLLRPAGLTYDEVCRHVGPITGGAARGDTPRRNSGGRAYGTPSGKIELRSSLLEKWRLDPLPAWEVPPLFADAGEKDFPLVLTTGGRDLRGFHQTAQQTPIYRESHPDPVVSLHPQTAARAGIAEDDWVDVATPIGSVRQRAHITDKLQPTVVHADRWWYPERADDPDDPFGFWATNINGCTDNAAANSDAIMGSWLLRGPPCRVSMPASP